MRVDKRRGGEGSQGKRSLKRNVYIDMHGRWGICVLNVIAGRTWLSLTDTVSILSNPNQFFFHVLQREKL